MCNYFIIFFSASTVGPLTYFFPVYSCQETAVLFCVKSIDIHRSALLGWFEHSLSNSIFEPEDFIL